MADISQIPRFTKYWMIGTLATSLIARFDFIGLSTLMFSRSLIYDFEIWRAITGLLVHPLHGSFGFHFLINCYFILQYGGRLEKEQFGRSPADFLYSLILIGGLTNIAGFFLNLHLLMDTCVLAITYIWCQLNKDVIVNFWFGARFKAIYLPWVLAGMDFIFHQSVTSLIGAVIGHIYYFMKFKYPQELGGIAILETPLLLKQYLPDINGGSSGFGVPPASRANERPAAGNHVLGNAWGRGHTLGN